MDIYTNLQRKTNNLLPELIIVGSLDTKRRLNQWLAMVVKYGFFRQRNKENL